MPCEVNTTIVNVGNDAEVVTLTDNENGTLTFDNGHGSILTFPSDPVESGVYNVGTQVLTLTLVSGNTVNISIPNIVTTLVNNNDGSYTYTSEDGTETTIETGNKSYKQLIPSGTDNISIIHSLSSLSVLFQIVSVSNKIVIPDNVIYLSTNTLMLDFVPALEEDVSIYIVK